VDRIGRRNIVPRREGFVVPAVAKGDGEHRIAWTNYVLSGRHCRTLRNRIVTIDHPHVARFGAGATHQQGAQDKASHQALKARVTHTLRNDCETHPPLPFVVAEKVGMPDSARSVASITGRTGFTFNEAKSLRAHVCK
jgi:hypothetical protein